MRSRLAAGDDYGIRPVEVGSWIGSSLVEGLGFRVQGLGLAWFEGLKGFFKGLEACVDGLKLQALRL